ncbi:MULTISPECIES: FAD-dependent monooxygenase [unclassified Rhodococcus (in: high G+C Gram-positive bacteria)]|uniref:FAD-dependent monooxygenase n=1 Tax=unclassified Rhodococcus (in: high G+C Gram-positive bacteria) TaxID=192944 RepID=UPI00163AEFCE|nr:MULTISPECIES: FAD-dependent monooxygenase [unclassified Rhodococcus (in: high G+C Gram-positive bacteria)]MBC2641336.1 FAD-dependent monooxygenase [Rhodococcus sp. 3A]MBC2893919.1 FAD-dependent monooxygenase [Rhodococcus sp. 4CII]
MTTIAVCGGGIGGLATALALRKFGLDVTVYEQTRQFARVGADINLTPNAVRALDGLGVGPAIRESAARPQFRISRTWDAGVETSRLPMGDTAEQQYGAPQLTMHRGDLMTALEDRLPPNLVHMGRRVSGVADGRIEFTDGSGASADVIVGADGIHSAVRTALLGREQPTFTGVVAFRAVVPTERVGDLPNLDCFTKWWGPDPSTQIVTFPLNQGKDIFIFATCAQDEWTEESWTTPGSVTELRDLYRDFHPEARTLLDACDEVLKSALYVRDPLESWTDGRSVLLGDAAHPMMPFMAQGAGMAIEDAVVLARCLSLFDDPVVALQTYQQTRLERTSRIQRGSRSNEWLKVSGNGDWVYEYDAWQVRLELASVRAGV